jgi:hypothetical protein
LSSYRAGLRLAPVVLAWILLSSGPAAAQQLPAPSNPRILATNEFGRFALGLSAGFQTWSLDGLEQTLDDRAKQLALDGFDFDSGDFGLTFSYGADLQYRLGRDWFALAQFEWTSLAFEDRDRSFLVALGSRNRTAVSIRYRSRVQTRPLLISIGAGRSMEFTSVRVGVTGKAIVAPVSVRDDLVIFIDTESESTVNSTGTGLGLETTASIDYFTETRTTLFVEAFGRVGSAEVSLEPGYWESTILPGKRRVDFGGIGVRLGMRWI